MLDLLSRDDLRMLTLTGPGGTGKTRLAIQAAAEAAEHFPDGITWVPLAALRDPSLFLPAVAQSGGDRLADGTLIGVANYAGCAARSEFVGTAAYGYCASKSEWVWGVRLVLRTDRRGLPLGYTLVPANEHEYEPLLDLVEQGETLIADKGLWGRAYKAKLERAEVRLLTPARERTADNAARERTLASLRLTIESTFANLKQQMRLEQHLARTPAGLAQRIAQRLLALTLGIPLNTLHGRPARALAAYDGR